MQRTHHSTRCQCLVADDKLQISWLRRRALALNPGSHMHGGDAAAEPSWRVLRCGHKLHSSGRLQRQKHSWPNGCFCPTSAFAFIPKPRYSWIEHICPHGNKSFQTEDAALRPNFSPCLYGRAYACRKDPATGDCSEGAHPKTLRDAEGLDGQRNVPHACAHFTAHLPPVL